MSAERRRRHGLVGRSLPAERLFEPRWLLRWRLASLSHRIASLERLLADEFGTTDTAPLVDELQALTTERAGLRKRLGLFG